MELEDDDAITGKSVSSPPASKKRHRADGSDGSGLLHGGVNWTFDYSNEKLETADSKFDGGLLHDPDSMIRAESLPPDMMLRADNPGDNTKIDKMLRADSRHTEKKLRAGIQCAFQHFNKKPLASSRCVPQPIDKNPLASSCREPQFVGKNPLASSRWATIDKNPLASSRSSSSEDDCTWLRSGELIPIDTNHCKLLQHGSDTGGDKLLNCELSLSSPKHDGDGGLLHSLPTTDEHEAWPNDLISVVAKVLEHSCECPSPPLFTFEMSREAAERNFCILVRHGMSLEKALNSQQHSPLGYGSEFRPSTVLAPLLRRHPNWERLQNLLTYGSNWILSHLDDDERAQDVTDALSFGNHKNATDNPVLLKQLLEQDVKYGFSLPLPLSKLTRIPGILVAPMNIMKQNTINEHGEIVPKDRLTHDQSYKWSSGTSVNSRIQPVRLLPCMFGGTLRRLINWAVAARRRYPRYRILATKADFKSAYRRCHLNWMTALTTCTQLPNDDLALLSLRLTFGGSPCPNEWGVISETICDLSNAILHDDNWDPLTLHSPSQHLVPCKEILSDDIPFAQVDDLIVDVPFNDRGFVDDYIDDLIGLTVDIPGSNNADRLERAPLLAIHTLARPLHPNEPIPRHDMAALNKLRAEAKLEETKIILGWFFDFRRMTVALPTNKYVAWSDALRSIITAGSTTASEMETNLGRLGHLGMVIPYVHHFLSRLRELHIRAKSRRSISVSPECIKDLQLMLDFLTHAHKGVSMNILAYRKPTHVYRSDSCPAGLGGYSHQGYAWRYYLPTELQFRATNNLLEHIASVISPWVDILNDRLQSGNCALSMTDSSTSEGWLRKTNFKEDGEEPIQASMRIEVARTHAKQYMDVGLREYSQWFAGKENNVADALSRELDLTDDELTNLLRLRFPSQMPSHFKIVPLPNEIVSWLTSLLQKLPVKEQLREEHMKSKLELGADGLHTADQSASNTICSSTNLPGISESKSLEPLPWLSAKDGSLNELMGPWLVNQSKVPSTLWQRPSGRTDTGTQPGTKTLTLRSFYNDSIELSRKETPKRSNRRHSRLTSSEQ